MQSVDFSQLHSAIIDEFKQKMPMLKTVSAYDPLSREGIKTPALLVELLEMKPARSLGDSRMSVNVDFCCHCCLSIKTEQVEIEIRNFAAKVLQVVNGNRWGLHEAVERPSDLSAFPGVFKPDAKGFESWVVAWEQVIHLGEVWQDVDFLPQEVFLGLAPDIGAAHQDKYEKIDG